MPQATFTTLNFSIVKRQHTVLAEIEGSRPTVLKIAFAGAEQFEREKAFYAERPSYAFVPDARLLNPHLIEIPYYPLPTLRQFAVGLFSTNAPDKFERLWQVAMLFLRDLKELTRCTELLPCVTEIGRLLGALGNLLRSGPAHTHRSMFSDVLSKNIWSALRPLIRAQLGQDFVYRDAGGESWCHGDLHLNNILVDEPNRFLRWIDWGTSYVGVPWRDVMYSSAMLSAILEEFSAGSSPMFHQRVAEDVLGNKPIAARTYRRWAPVYTAFAMANSRFSVDRDELTAAVSLVSLTRLVFRLTGRSKHQRNRPG